MNAKPRFEPWDSPCYGADPSDYSFDRVGPALDCEDNPVTGVLYGPRGEILHVQRERRTVTIGFRPGPR